MKNNLALLLLLLLGVTLGAQSVVQTVSVPSAALGVSKQYRIYLPDGYFDDTTTRYPVVYFLRLHQTEWFNAGLRANGQMLQDVADALIEDGVIGKVILVGPNTGTNSGQSPGIVNLLRPDLAVGGGVGTGRFEDYFVEDFITHIDATYRTLADRCYRGIDGFSLGGFSSLLYAFKHPGLFASVGSYDGSVYWYDLDDPATPGPADDVFIVEGAEYFAPMYGSPLDLEYMKQHSPVQLLVDAEPATLDSIRAMAFHIQAVESSGNSGNRRVNQALIDSMSVRGIANSFDSLPLAPGATHNFQWADEHARQALIKHWEIFADPENCAALPTGTALPAKAGLPGLGQNYPNPVYAATLVPLHLPVPARIELTLLDQFGRTVETLIDEWLPEGRHTVTVDAGKLPAGIYYYQLKTAGTVRTRKMIVL